MTKFNNLYIILNYTCDPLNNMSKSNFSENTKVMYRTCHLMLNLNYMHNKMGKYILISEYCIHLQLVPLLLYKKNPQSLLSQLLDSNHS